LTKVDFTEILEHHNRCQFDATICVRELEHQIAFGVIESQADIITAMVEKPVFRYQVNTGIYVLSPDCASAVPAGTKIDMPTLLERRMEQEKKVGIFASYDYWLDIGRMSDY